MTRHTLHYLGFATPQQEAIAAILALADAALSCDWIIVDSQDCDVIMVNLDSEEGAQHYETELQSRPVHRIVAVSDDPSRMGQQGWFLNKKAHAPPSLKELATLLNNVAVVLAQARANAEVVAVTESISPLAIAAETSHLDEAGQQPPVIRPLNAENYFFGTLLQAKQDNIRRLIKLTAVTALYLSPADGSYYFEGTETDLLAYCTAPVQDLSETQITKARLNKLIKNQPLTAKPFAELLIYAILKAATGRILDGHSPAQKVKLKALPDPNSPGLAPYQQIASMLYKQAQPLLDVAESLQVPIAQVFDFYNICSLLGYLEATAPNPPTPLQKQGVLSHFLKAFLGHHEA